MMLRLVVMVVAAFAIALPAAAWAATPDTVQYGKNVKQQLAAPKKTTGGIEGAVKKPSAAPVVRGTLPFTGSNIVLPVVLAGMLLTGGMALRLRARKRRE
jgi:hypothetical protein